MVISNNARTAIGLVTAFVRNGCMTGRTGETEADYVEGAVFKACLGTSEGDAKSRSVSKQMCLVVLARQPCSGCTVWCFENSCVAGLAGQVTASRIRSCHFSPRHSLRVALNHDQEFSRVRINLVVLRPSARVADLKSKSRKVAIRQH